MKAINRFFFGLAAGCFVLVSCAGENSDSTQAQPPKEAVEQGSFDSFLDKFEETVSYDSWDKKVVDVAGGDGGVYDPDEVQDQTFRKHFSKLGPEFHHFLPVRPLVNLDPEFSDDIPDPLNAYRFWATFRTKMVSSWLVCVLAVKREWVSKEGYHEFHAHPVLLITYSESGELVDHFLWTYFIDDAEQIYEDVDVVDGIFVSGYSPRYGKAIEKIYSRTSINDGGKFQSLFRATKEGLDFEDGM